MVSYNSRVFYTDINWNKSTYAFSFPYTDTDYVKVYIDGNALPHDFGDGNVTYVVAGLALISLSNYTEAIDGMDLEIRRETSLTPDVDFVNGTTLTESDLDGAVAQSLHLAVEAKDNTIGSLSLDPGGVYLDADNDQIKNLAAGTATTDAVTKAQLDAGGTATVANTAALTLLNKTDKTEGSAPKYDSDGNITFTSNTKLENITAGSNAASAINKAYVDARVSGIPDGGIGTDTIADSAVTTAKIANDNITTAKIADDNVTEDKIADGAVTFSKLAGNSVTAAAISNNAVGSSELSADCVTEAKIAFAAVGTGQIAENAVTIYSMANNSVGTSEIVGSAVETGKIADLNVTRAKIADGAINTDKVAPDAIDGTKIADDSIDSEHIAADSIDTEHISDGAVDTDAIALYSVNAQRLSTGSIATSKYQDNSITNDKLQNGCVEHLTLDLDSVGSSNIIDGSIDAVHLSSDSIQTAKIVDQAVTNAKLAIGVIANDKFASMPASTIKGNNAGTGGPPLDLTVAQTNTLLGLDLKLMPKAFGSFTTVASPVVSGESFNISGVTQVSTGRYTVNFTDNMSDVGYTVTVSYMDSSETIFLCMLSSKAVGSFNISLKDASGTLSDASETVDIVVHEYV